MQEFNFNVSGQRRKELVGAISEITNQPIKYLGMPSAAYEIGKYHIDKTGTVTGEYDLNLFVGLAERGFEPEIAPISAEDSDEPEVYTAPEESAADELDRLTVEVPNDFTPEQINNLSKMTAAKEPLLKKALGAEKLPIRVTEDKVAFPWFTLEKPGDTACYIQFIAALCNTAKEKKRVTAKAHESFENEKFSMRVWLIGLGLVGKEYGNTRKLLGKNLSGNSGWRYGKPEAAPAAEEAHAEEAQSDE